MKSHQVKRTNLLNNAKGGLKYLETRHNYSKWLEKLRHMILNNMKKFFQPFGIVVSSFQILLPPLAFSIV